jgi:hypothetical protein
MQDENMFHSVQLQKGIKNFELKRLKQQAGFRT